MKLEEETLGKEIVFEGRLIRVEVEDVRLPDHSHSKREIVRHPGAVAVIAHDENGRLVLVRQYRKALGKVIYEIPAGKKETGEESLVTAQRELEEETGYTASEWKEITSFYTSPGFADECIELYEAKGLTLSQGLQTDEDEFLEVVHVTLEEANELQKEKKIHDAKTAYALLYLANR
ncbi:NUDIX domain-containing protein [Aureibacillus halotolerans]|uniref:ADP-ribose pyrophosphatase n=1 Tax=Aureibacillus halotolerans TaxID=1508390 RepID=A0A4R6U7F8_9BACI|nr:NUDIX hydrolase [Aureibacillus halotolerans]TDQ41612.1 ADP-ribose pyrophosphatase [Aureibacillus halotolerans]